MQFNPAAVIFMSSPANKNESWPNVEILMNPHSPTTDVYDQDIFMMVPILARPKSLGYIKLASKNFTIKPRINPNWLNDSRDVRDLVDSMYLTVWKLASVSSQYLHNVRGLKYKEQWKTFFCYSSITLQFLSQKVLERKWVSIIS